jgi:hypothetical protein
MTDLEKITIMLWYYHRDREVIICEDEVKDTDIPF